MKPPFFLLASCVFLISGCNLARQYTEQPLSTVKGMLLHRPWAKTAQSYCAQGSDYWVLKQEAEEQVLAWPDESLLEKAAKLNGKTVTIRGIWSRKKVSPPDHAISQHPVGADGDNTFECVVLSVIKLQ